MHYLLTTIRSNQVHKGLSDSKVYTTPITYVDNPMLKITIKIISKS